MERVMGVSGRYPWLTITYLTSYLTIPRSLVAMNSAR